jgi:hypothetical protein
MDYIWNLDQYRACCELKAFPNHDIFFTVNLAYFYLLDFPLLQYICRYFQILLCRTQQGFNP